MQGGNLESQTFGNLLRRAGKVASSSSQKPDCETLADMFSKLQGIITEYGVYGGLIINQSHILST